MLAARHANRPVETTPLEACSSDALDTDLDPSRQEFLAWLGIHRVACSENHLRAVLQDAPQRARKGMKTLRELREEAQHVVEVRSVDDNMDEEEACEKDAEKDEEEGTCMAEDRQLRLRRLEGAVLEEGMAVGSRLLEVDIDDDRSEEVEEGAEEEEGHGGMQWPDCKAQRANVAEKGVAGKEEFPLNSSY